MTAKHYCLAKWYPTTALRPIAPEVLPEAQEYAVTWAVVAAFSKRHALRLWHEGVEGVRGADGRLERCGIVREGGAHD